MVGNHIAIITSKEKPLNSIPTIAINRPRDAASPPLDDHPLPARRQFRHETKVPPAASSNVNSVTGNTLALFP
jgi:hypothetical protein